MLRKRVVLFLILSIILAMFLGPSVLPSTTTSSIDQEEPCIEIEPDYLISPNKSATPAEIPWNWAATTNLFNDPYGIADIPSNLATDDGSLCRLTEEYASSSYQIDLRFRTSTAVYAHQYLHHQLRMEFSQVWSFQYEYLKFYVCLASAQGNEGTYTYIGQLSNPGVYSFDIDQFILFDDSIKTARYLYIRVLGAIENSDGTGNSYDFDYLGIAYKGHVPYLSNTPDWDAVEGIGMGYLFPHYGINRNYAVFSATYVCYDGGSELSTFEYSYYDLMQAGGWKVSYLSDHFVMEYSGSSNSSWASLVPSACSISTTSTSRTFTFGVLIEWSHPRGSQFSTPNTFSASTSEASSIEEYTEYWVYPGLSMQTVPAISESRVNTGSPCTYSGDIYYTGSESIHTSPLASEVDIQVRRYSPSETSWVYTAQPASDGTFTVNPSTASSSGTNTFELRVVPDGETTNLLTTTYSDTVIGDRVVVSSGSNRSINYNPTYGGGVRNTGQSDTLYLKLQWESSGTPITSGTVSWASSGNTVSMAYDSGDDSRWEGSTYSRSTTGMLTYNDLIVNIDGVTSVKVEPSYKVVWDEIVILTTVIEGGDDYVNIGNSVTIRVTAELDYLGHALVPGLDTLYMNGVEMSAGGAYFTYTVSHLYPGLWTYSVDDANLLENTYGITKIATGKPSVSCTWDTFSVDLSVDDAHVSIGDVVRIWAHVTRAYDGSIFTDSMGSVVLRHATSSDISMTYSSIDGLWYADVTQNTVNQWTYFIYSISDTVEQISTVGRGMNFDGSNDYVNCGSDLSLDLTSALTLSTWFYGDGSDWGSGMYLLAKKDNNNAQYSLYVHSDGTLHFVYYNGVLREIPLRTGVTRNVWHHVIVTVSGTTLNCWYDGIHVQDDYSLPIALVSYPSVPVYIGAQKAGAGTSYHLEGFISEVQIYSNTLSDVECELLYQGQYPETTNLRLHLARASTDVSSGFWNDLSSSSNDGAIFQTTVLLGSLPMSSDEVVRIIWDQVKVIGFSSDDLTINVGLVSSTHVELQYVFSGNPVVDGTVTINGLSASPSVTLGTWNFSETKATAQASTYDTVVYSGGRYSLSSVNQNVQTLTQVWDEVKILTTTVVDGRINTGLQAEIRVTASLTYYSSHMLGGSDTLYMDGIKMLWSPTGYFYYRPSQSSYGTFNYAVNLTNALEGTYQITSVNLDGNSVDVSWDTLIVTITDPIDQRINIGTNASGIIVSVIYALDSQPYDGSIILNNTVFQFSTVGRRGYSLFPFTGDDIYGITAVETNDETWCIWDSITITITDPSPQTLFVGQNASGIVVTAIYAYDDLPFDGNIQLNNTLFSYLTPGHRGYTVSNISGGSHNITVIGMNDEIYAIWVLQQATLHLDTPETNILVSTIYDPQEFQIEVYLTNSSMNMISGWVNLTIDGEDYALYCDGIVNSIFNYTPLVSTVYTLAAVFEGDSDYGSTETSILLTATPRDIIFTDGIPTEITALISSPFGFLNVYDNDFGGEFQGVTYMRNLPINASFSIWWTISSNYGNPRIFTGTWNITTGEGSGPVTVPWDLDGNGWLTSTDFICYFVIFLDGHGVYENVTIEIPVDVLHPLKVDLQIPTLTYSDQSTLSFQIHPLFDPSFTDGLDLTITLLISIDNTTWVLVSEVITTASGWQSMNWTCMTSGTLFFKAVIMSSEFYTESSGYAHSVVEKETTVLTIESVGNFTYSDQGVLVALLTTDDGEPLSDQTVFLELLDGTWISIGSGLTNDSGHVSILWTPTLSADTYSIQIRVSLAGSQYYLTPSNALGQLEVRKEFTMVSIDSATAAQGFVRARVTDDDGTPVLGIQVHFYAGSSREYRGAGITDNDGYTRLNITLNDGETLEAVINEDNFYYGAHQEVTIAIPLDLLFIGIVVGFLVLPVATVIAVSRKIIRGRRVSSPPSPTEVSKALEEERDSIPKRVREHSEKRLAELDGMGRDSAELSETPSIDDDIT